MRRLACVLFVIAQLRAVAAAAPEGGPTAGDAHHDPDAAVADSAAPAPASAAGTPGASDAPRATPWIDLGPSPLLAAPARASGRGLRDPRVASALTLGGLYAGFVTWTYFAWYRKPGHAFRWGGDGTWRIWEDEGWFGATQYAGGADKMGHAWATLALARAGTELLHQWGGHSRFTSALVGALLSEALFFGVEVKDGYLYQFSFGDFWFNTAGAALAFAQSMWPGVDDAIDFRVQYVPSPRYREKFRDGDVDVAEDYSGQTYLLAFHLGAIRPLREARWTGWTRYVDVVAGFESRGYKPDPPYAIDPDDPARQDYPKRQTVFLGVALDAQAVFDRLLRGRSEPLRKLAHGALEVFALPGTTLRVAGHDRRPLGPVPDEQ